MDELTDSPADQAGMKPGMESEAAAYERGWQDAITHTNPPGALERSRLNAVALRLVRRFTDAMTHLSSDMAHIAQAMEALDAPLPAEPLCPACQRPVTATTEHVRERWLTTTSAGVVETTAYDVRAEPCGHQQIELRNRFVGSREASDG
jgi:hypothetical protein